MSYKVAVKLPLHMGEYIVDMKTVEEQVLVILTSEKRFFYVNDKYEAVEIIGDPI